MGIVFHIMTRGERIVKRKGLLFFIVMLLSLSMIGTASAAPKLRIMVNNSSVDVGVQIVSGKTLVPLKALKDSRILLFNGMPIPSKLRLLEIL